MYKFQSRKIATQRKMSGAATSRSLFENPWQATILKIFAYCAKLSTSGSCSTLSMAPSPPNEEDGRARLRLDALVSLRAPRRFGAATKPFSPSLQPRSNLSPLRFLKPSPFLTLSSLHVPPFSLRILSSSLARRFATSSYAICFVRL